MHSVCLLEKLSKNMNLDFIDLKIKVKIEKIVF